VSPGLFAAECGFREHGSRQHVNVFWKKKRRCEFWLRKIAVFVSYDVENEIE
jgi:hypothetical protein